ncbi:MAG: hypothetical protein ACD_9C00099G0002 [uncultured bacterium]|nr:MAG: hypothetical protein ACD_9C00099G0002 [uncultured bacterium]
MPLSRKFKIFIIIFFFIFLHLEKKDSYAAPAGELDVSFNPGAGASGPILCTTSSA